MNKEMRRLNRAIRYAEQGNLALATIVVRRTLRNSTKAQGGLAAMTGSKEYDTFMKSVRDWFFVPDKGHALMERLAARDKARKEFKK